MTSSELQGLAVGVVGYVLKVPLDRAAHLMGRSTPLTYCLCDADGRAISLSGSREAAICDAANQQLILATVH